jgi:hypothetical protein
MNEFPDQETKLTNFLRQNRSIAPPESPELEDRLMVEIDLLPIEKQPIISHSWQRYLLGGIGLIVTGIAGVAIFQIINPPEPSIAELDQLNLFLEAHAPTLASHSELDSTSYEDLGDLDPELF